MVIVSACLLGIDTRYDCKIKEYPQIWEIINHSSPVPVCPEQLGGLSTPRHPSFIIGGDGYDVLKKRAAVYNERGEDVTSNFLKGAEETLKIVKLLNIKQAILKAKSPSCGLTPVLGVTSALLILNGIEVMEV